MTRLGYVAEAAIEQLAATLATRHPERPDTETRADALQQVQDLRAAGWRIAAPTGALTKRPAANRA